MVLERQQPVVLPVQADEHQVLSQIDVLVGPEPDALLIGYAAIRDAEELKRRLLGYLSKRPGELLERGVLRLSHGAPP